jgi:ribosomal protein S27AE
MAMWRAKSCPKCSGDTFLDIDEDTWFDHCLQCGYMGVKSKVVCPNCGDEMRLKDVSYLCRHCGHISSLSQAVV